MDFKRRTLSALADMICGNYPQEESFFPYRSSSYITSFFEEADTDFAHDGSTRAYWVAGVLAEILSEPQPAPNTPPDTFARVIRCLMDQDDATNEGAERPGALAMLNGALKREGFEAFYAEDHQCYLRHVATNTVAAPAPNPHRPFRPRRSRGVTSSLPILIRHQRTSSSKKCCSPCFASWGFTASQRLDTKIKLWSMARTCG